MTTTAPEASQPVVAIRTKPPSPRRLSGKVLIAASALTGTLISGALLLGLSPQAHHAAAQPQATPAAGGPPEIIAHASSQYDPTSFEPPALDLTPPAEETTLQPPHDSAWGNTPTQHNSIVAPAASSAAPQPTARDPQALARAAPILFAQTREGAGAATTQSGDGANLDATLSPPHSRYEIQAGNVIPAALITGLNSDLAGRVIAQVTAPVYDSVTGEHLLIPQGARLLGTYDTGVRYGDHRIVLAWNRLILPNGWSIDLHQMSAADATGAAGLSDKVDNHLGSLTGAIGLSAILSVIANQSEDDHQQDGSLAQNVGDAAAQQAAQTGSQIVQRELSVHPTLRVRPGASVRVLVMRDIALRPYR